MALITKSIYIDETTGKAVRSQTDYSEIPLLAATVGDKIICNVYIVNRDSGGFAAVADDTGVLTKAGIGTRGSTLSVTLSGVAKITNGWQVAVDLSQSPMVTYMSGKTTERLYLGFQFASGSSYRAQFLIPIVVSSAAITDEAVSDPPTGTPISREEVESEFLPSSTGFENLSNGSASAPGFPEDGQVVVWNNTQGRHVSGGAAVNALAKSEMPLAIPSIGGSELMHVPFTMRGSGDELALVSNAYWDGSSYKFLSDGYAHRIRFTGTDIIYYRSSISGSIDGTITWTQVGTSIQVDKILPGSGSAAAPSMAFGSDTNTGIFRPGSSTVGIAGGGVELARFSAAAFRITRAIPIEMQDIATPSNPQSGYFRLYLKSDGQLYVLNSAGVESQIGGGLSTSVSGLSDGDILVYNSGTGVWENAAQTATYSVKASATDSSPGVLEDKVSPSGGIEVHSDALQLTGADTAAAGQVPTKQGDGTVVFATPAGAGDMLQATYDPTGTNGDAFDMANMAEAADAKILTAAERTKLAGIETGATGDQTGAEIEALLDTELGGATWKSQVAVASQSEVDTGTEAAKYVSPDTLSDAQCSTRMWRPWNDNAGTSITLALTDAQKVLKATSGSAVTVTVPPNSSVAFAVGTEIEVVQYGAGVVSIAAGAGVTVNTARASNDLEQYGAAVLKKVATDEWILI